MRARAFIRCGAGFAACLCVALAAGLPVAGAQDRDPAELEARNIENRREYDRLRQQITLSDERLKTLEQDVAAIRKDNASLTAALIQAAKTEKKISEDVSDIEARLDTLEKRKFDIHTSLKLRRGILAEVLGALQRMGLNPPPALLVTPEDALASVRSAILLGAVVPEMRAETEILFTDLQSLARITASIGDERQRLVERMTEQAAEKERLGRLLAERKRLQTQSEAEMMAERRKAEELVGKASNLKDLIASLESEIGSIRRAREEARRAEEERKRREAELANRPVPRGNRLELSRSFSQLRGKVALPVAGRIVARFGSRDGVGGKRNGDTVQTQSGAIVTAPTDAIVLYSGPFRSYGQVLILDAGDGYHVVMAGLDRINAAFGQSVLAGEPVGAMGEIRLASSVAHKTGNNSPELYVEFRKNGKPVDPAPWWADRRTGRTANDS
ncbi:MAG: murein hydrolase activator EnvC [Rhizobiaceae bacterium]